MNRQSSSQHIDPSTPDESRTRAPSSTDRTIFLQPGSSNPGGAVPSDEHTAARQTIGRYTITGFLGHGGNALVYEARDEDDAPVALKIMEETPAQPAEVLRRFRREANMAKTLRRHPNIVTVYDTGESGTTHYIAMELVSGRSVIERLSQGALGIPQALDIAIDIASALQYAHERGIVHRDLKPSNVLLSEFNRPLLADFGLAREEADKGLTLSQTTIGTPHYMSPEQTMSANVDARTDIYSLGVMLYEMVTGRLPYSLTENATMASVFDAIRSEIPKSPRKLQRRVSRNLEAVIMKLLEKEPRLRYQDMSRVRTDLEACRANQPVSVRMPNAFERFDRVIRRHKLIAAASVTSLLTIVGLSLSFHQRLQRERLEALEPKLEAERKTRELVRLRQQVRKQTGSANLTEQVVTRAHGDLRNGAPESALARLNGLLDTAASYEETPSPSARHERARVLLAAGRFEDAARDFQTVASTLRGTPGEQMATFETGLARELAGDRESAERIWRELARTLRRQQSSGSATRAGYPGIEYLCSVAVGEMPPPDAARAAESRPPVIQAIGYFLASRRSADSEQARLWRQRAHTAAWHGLPWLFSFLAEGSTVQKPTEVQSDEDLVDQTP